MTIQKSGFCSLCGSQCAAIYSIDDGKLVKVDPQPAHPTGGALCLKGKAAPEIIYNTDRILTPLRRTAPKGAEDPGWQPISWDEALAETARALSDLRSRHGAESVAFATTTPAGTGLADSIDWIDRLIRVFGSPNKVSTVELCDFHKEFSHAFTFGRGIGYPDYAQSDTILLWGFNPSSTWLNNSQRVGDAMARGAEVLVVDPRPAGFAMGATEWMRIRPGADGILAMAMAVARWLLENDAYDVGFVRRYTTATLLVRRDTGKYLRASDLAAADLAASGADPQAYLAWDASTRALVSYSARTRCFSGPVETLALDGDITVTAADGTELMCRPAFALYRAATAPYSLAYAARHCWISEDQILAFARKVAAAKRLSYYVWTGVSQHAHATQQDRAIALLMMLKGCYDQPGGNVILTEPGHRQVGSLDLLPEGMLAQTVGLDELPLGPPRDGMVTAQHFYRAATQDIPYRLRGLVSFGANMAVAHAGTEAAQEALQRLDFYVHIDMQENPTAKFADIILPVNTIWEYEGLRTGFNADQATRAHIQLRQQMVPSRGDSRSDVEVCFALGKALGHGDAFFEGDVDKGYDHLLEPLGLTVAQLRQAPDGISLPLETTYAKYARPVGEGIEGFATETGLIEISSELLLRHGQPALPSLSPQDLPGGLDKPEFPFALTTAKSGYFCHSQHRNVPSLRQREPDPVVELSPAAAEARALKSGEWVYVRTPKAQVKMRLKINEALHDLVARGSYGWWQANSVMGLPGYDPFSPEGSNYNLLIDGQHYDPVSGTPGNRSASCEIVPVEDPDRPRPAWGGFRDTRVVSTTPVTDDVLEILLEPLGDGPIPDFLPGQHVPFRVRLPDGSDLLRFYSLTCAAVEAGRGRYSIAVRRVPAPRGSDWPAGRMSGHIHDRLAPGDIVGIKRPQGSFHFPIESERPLVFVAGGIGITPFLSYLRTLARLRSGQRVHLVYGNRSRQSHAFLDEIAALARALPGLTLRNVYNEEPDMAALRPGDRIGIISAEDILLDDLRGARPLVYQCGPPVMMAAVRAALMAQGFAEADLREEAFTAPAATSEPLPEGPYQVTFRNEDTTLTWTLPQGSLLEMGEAAGVPLKSGCRVGQCESCAVKVRSGSFMYRVKLDRPDDGQCLLCQAVPTSDIEFDI